MSHDAQCEGPTPMGCGCDSRRKTGQTGTQRKAASDAYWTAVNAANAAYDAEIRGPEEARDAALQKALDDFRKQVDGD